MMTEHFDATNDVESGSAKNFTFILNFDIQ